MIPPFKLTRNFISPQASPLLHRYISHLLHPCMTTSSSLSAGGLASSLTIRWGSPQPAPPKKRTCICIHLCFSRHTGKMPSSPHVTPLWCSTSTLSPLFKDKGASVRRHLIAHLSYNQCPSYRKPSVSVPSLPSHPLHSCTSSHQAETSGHYPSLTCCHLPSLCLSTNTAFLTVTNNHLFCWTQRFWSANLLWPLCPA